MKGKQVTILHWPLPVTFHSWSSLLVTFCLLLLSSNHCVNYSNGFKYIALETSTTRVNVTLPESQFHVNNVTLTDNSILDSNDSEEGHSKVVKTISSLLAESLNKSIGHFQYIQDKHFHTDPNNSENDGNNQESSSTESLRLSLTSSSALSDNSPVSCAKSIQSIDSNSEDSSNESESVILDNEDGLNSSNITDNASDQKVQNEIETTSAPASFYPSNLVTQVTGFSDTTKPPVTSYKNTGSSYSDDDDDDGEDNDDSDVSDHRVSYGSNNDGDKINLRKYFRSTTRASSSTESSTDPSPVYQPEGIFKVHAATVQKEVDQSSNNQLERDNSDTNKRSNDTVQFICIKVIDGKVTSPLLAKEIYPHLKDPSLVMPTVPKIPLTYSAFKNYIFNDRRPYDGYNHTNYYNKTKTVVDGTSTGDGKLESSDQRTGRLTAYSTGRQAKHYVQRYYPVNLFSLDAIKSRSNGNYTLTYPRSSENKSDFVDNDQRRTSSPTSANDVLVTTTSPATFTSETKSDHYQAKISRTDSDRVKYKPITYKTTVIIPKITTTSVSLSTNYPKSFTKKLPSSVTTATMTTTTPMPSTSVVTSSSASFSLADIPELQSTLNKIAYESEDGSRSKIRVNKMKEQFNKEFKDLYVKSTNYHKKSDKSSKKDFNMMNSGSSISSQRLGKSRISFPGPSSGDHQQPSSTLDTLSFDSFELPQSTDDPLLLPNTLIRPSFGLSSIGQAGQQPHHQVTSSNQNPFHHHHHPSAFHHLGHHRLQQTPSSNQQIAYTPQQSQQLTPSVANQPNLLPEALPSSTLLPNDLAESPLIGLISPISSSYRGLASKIKSAINFSSKQPQPQPQPSQPSQQIYQHSQHQHPYPFGYNSYEQPTAYESVYGKLSSHPSSSDLLYPYDQRLNYKPENSLMTPYLTNLQGAFIRQPTSKILRQYQALMSSASSMTNQRNPTSIVSSLTQPNQLSMGQSQQQAQLQSNRQAPLIPSTPAFYPVFQPISNLPLNPQPFTETQPINPINTGYHHHLNHHLHNSQLRQPGSILSSIPHRFQSNYLSAIEAGQSRIVSRDRGFEEASGSSVKSSTSTSNASSDIKNQLKTVRSSTHRGRSKTSPSRSRNSKSKSKNRKNRRSNHMSKSSSLFNTSPTGDKYQSSLSKSFRTSSLPKTNRPCSSGGLKDCQSAGGLMLNPSRSVKFELRDALS